MNPRCAVLAALFFVALPVACRPPLASTTPKPDADYQLDPPSLTVPVDAGADAALPPDPADAAADAHEPPDGPTVDPLVADAGDGDAPGGPAGRADGGWIGPELIVAVGNDGRRLLSADGKVWYGDTRETSGNKDGPLALRAAAYGGGQVVAVGGGCVPTCASRIVTFDGRTWREVSTDVRSRLNGVAYGDGVWVAVGSAAPILRSTDGGRTWNPAAKIAVPAGLRAVAHGRVGGQPMFVAVGDGYTRVTSPDGLNWTNLEPADGSQDGIGFRAVAIGNDVAVAVGGNSGAGRRMRTLDGVTWEDDVGGGPDLFSAVFIDGQFMVFSAAADDTLHASPEGKDWRTQRTTSAGSNIAAGTFLGKRFFVSRVTPSSIRISIDGYVWAQTPVMSMPGDSVLNAFVIAGN